MRNKKYSNCPWFVLIVHWAEKQIQIFISLNGQELEEIANKLSSRTNLVRPLDGLPNSNIPQLTVRRLMWAGDKRGPTEKTLRKQFSKLIPAGSQIKIERDPQGVDLNFIKSTNTA